MLNDRYVYQRSFHTYEVYYASEAVSSSLVRQITYQTVLGHLRCLVFFHSLLSNCLSLMGKSTLWFSFSEFKINGKNVSNTSTILIQKCKIDQSLGYFKIILQKERPNYFQILWSMLFHKQISNFAGIIFVLLMQMRGFPSGLDRKLKRKGSCVSRI